MCDYVCPLDAKTIEKARVELNEDPLQRNGQIQALKDWIHEQKWISIPTDNFFLAGILRGTKFSQLLARELIIYIAHTPSKRPLWPRARNPVSPEFRKCMAVGHNIILPKKDAEGQTIIIARPALQSNGTLIEDDIDKSNILNDFFVSQTVLNDQDLDIPALPPFSLGRPLNNIVITDDEFKVKDSIPFVGVIDTSGEPYSADSLYQVTAAMANKLSMDESVQVNGVVVIVDFTGLSMKHVSFGFHIYKEALREAKKYGHKVPIDMDPHRLKGVHCYNNDKILETLHDIAMKMDIVKERVTMIKKLEKKVVFHGRSLETIYDYIDKSLLPDEYLPDDYNGPSAGPIKQIVDDFIESMSAPDVLDWFNRFHSVTGVDLSKKPRDDEPQASFRKLSTS
ncbi:hypothetical protein ScPMuIL_001597 [Solemya velum]